MLWFLILACEDVKPVDTGSADPVASIDTSIEEEEEIFEPALFTIFSTFGVEGGNIRSFWINETEIRPYIQLIFYNADQSQACTVAAFWDSESVVLEDWNFEDVTDSDNPVQMMQKGFSVPEMSTLDIVTGDGCSDWDTDRYGRLEDKIDHAWGIGFGGSLRADVEQAVQESTNETLLSLYENEYLIGGSWSADLWEPSTWASHIFTVSPQQDWQLDVDENGRPTAYYTRTEVENGEEGSIYMLNPLFLWDYNTFFLE